MPSDPVAETIRSILGPRLTPAETATLVAAMQPRGVAPGEPICREGDEAVGLLLLLHGTAEVLKGGHERLATVEAPTVLGEMSLLTNGRHTATVRAQTACDLRLLPKAEFLRLVEQDSPAAYKLLATVAEVLARRLYRMDEKVVELAAQHRPIEELAAFKQKLFTEWSF
jgi:CBS domain-containing protein